MTLREKRTVSEKACDCHVKFRTSDAAQLGLVYDLLAAIDCGADADVWVHVGGSVDMQEVLRHAAFIMCMESEITKVNSYAN